jgi:hypothetical protein
VRHVVAPSAPMRSNRGMSANPSTAFASGREQLFDAFKWPLIGAGITLVLILIWSLWPAVNPSADGFELVDDIDPPVPAELTLDAETAAAAGAQTLIIAKHIVVKGIVRLPNDRVIAANDITFEAGGHIVVPSGRLTIVAPRITRAAIDVSGRSGLDGMKAGTAGGDGETAGIVLAAAAAFTESQIVAKGGDGGDGARGYTGAPGRSGYCGPHGFGLAEHGAVGGAGGRGGRGGAGGLITLLHEQAAAKATATAGAAGTAGRGGSGGRGGAGCKGLRGNQPNQPPGNEGVGGRNGSHGDNGSVEARHVDFDLVIDTFEDWAETPNHTAGQLRDRLLALRQLEPS